VALNGLIETSRATRSQPHLRALRVSEAFGVAYWLLDYATLRFSDCYSYWRPSIKYDVKLDKDFNVTSMIFQNVPRIPNFQKATSSRVTEIASCHGRAYEAKAVNS
jgi:hypothetical protein